MDHFYFELRLLHIIAGFVGFFAAPIVLTVAKGDTLHRVFGRLYFWALAIAAMSAIVLSLIRSNNFLLLVAVFSFYLAFKGYRSLYQKGLMLGEKVKNIDWIATVILLVCSLLMVIYSIAIMKQLGVVLLVFGIIGLLLGGNDILMFLKPPKDKHSWLFNHITGMVSSYIAAVSAFSVTTFSFLPSIVRWLWPTVIGTLAIIFILKTYRKKIVEQKEPSRFLTIRILPLSSNE